MSIFLRALAPQHETLVYPDVPSCRPVRLDLSAESATIQQCFSLTTNQRTVLSAQ
jgi:hypothetical protein